MYYLQSYINAKNGNNKKDNFLKWTNQFYFYFNNYFSDESQKVSDHAFALLPPNLSCEKLTPLPTVD